MVSQRKDIGAEGRGPSNGTGAHDVAPPGSLSEIYTEHFGKQARKHEKEVRSGQDIVTSRVTTESLQGRQTLEKEVETVNLAACGHLLAKDSYELPDGRRTCNADTCRRTCEFLCQRILPTRELWIVGQKRVCSACLFWKLAWEAFRGLGLVVRGIVAAVGKFA